tara:strand:- start:2549 stop:3040 length:492 start_codon:yes stop_codon:yes gene_type:complete
MIINCTKCFKKFKISSDLIPEKGRLLQCSSCNHQWFFTKKVNPITTRSEESYDIDSIDANYNNNIGANQDNNKKNINIDLNPNDSINDNIVGEKTDLIVVKKIVKNNKLLNIILVFIISFTAFIILIDTFKYPISKLIPNIEFMLYNLYESIKDIQLFFKDLI